MGMEVSERGSSSSVAPSVAGVADHIASWATIEEKRILQIWQGRSALSTIERVAGDALYYAKNEAGNGTTCRLRIWNVETLAC